MKSPKVHRRSITAVSQYHHFCTIITLVLIAADGHCASIGGYARPLRSSSHRNPSADRLMTTIADAHNLIAAATPSISDTSAASSLSSSSSTTTTAGTALKVCTFKLHRLADAQFDGKITVLMPVSASTFVRRQAYMFNKLEARFRHAGFTQVQFVVVYPAVAADGGDLGAETAPAPTVMHLPIEDRFERSDSVFNVTVLRNLDATLSQTFVPTAAYVFDQCGRFTYIIYAPWSSIQRPYVKASILSTIYDEPCGLCEMHSSPYPVHLPASIAAAATMNRTSALTKSTTAFHSNGSSSASSTESSVTSESTPNDQSSSTATIVATNVNPKRNVPIHTVPDTSFVMPIRVIASIVHAHREHFPDASNGTTTSNSTAQYYLKYNYIVMRSNDPNYHAHLPTDVPERLALIERPMAADQRNTTQAASADQPDRPDDQLADESQKSTTSTLSAPVGVGASAATELHFITDYGKRYVSLASSGAPSVEEDAKHRDRTNNATPDEQRGQGQTGNPFDVDFVNLEEIPRHNSKQRSNTGRMVTRTQIQFQSVADQRSEEDVLVANGQEERAINDHYGKIIQWIQFNL